ncbi:MAG: HNH endonuclease [Pseudomonadales bacterium]|nr:HNH endonuclease [Pseudomonadales bacterium]
MENAQILRLDKTGYPIEWLTAQDACSLLVNEKVVWAFGENATVLKGGFNRDGLQSELEIPAIIATHGRAKIIADVPPLSNRMLFRRDRHMCLYCGNTFKANELTRDHIIPQSKGGRSTWKNLVACCKSCNNAKRDRTPEEAGMPLLAVPFVPSRHEYLYLSNHYILADQMQMLKSGIRKDLIRAA